MNARTSCAQRQATTIFAAHASAASREGTSMIVSPPMYAAVVERDQIPRHLMTPFSEATVA
jgi:hypothetical protein